MDPLKPKSTAIASPSVSGARGSATAHIFAAVVLWIAIACGLTWLVKWAERSGHTTLWQVLGELAFFLATILWAASKMDGDDENDPW
jgi:hypothetical protein